LVKWSEEKSKKIRQTKKNTAFDQRPAKGKALRGGGGGDRY